MRIGKNYKFKENILNNTVPKIDKETYRYFQDLIFQTAGIRVDDSRYSMVCSRIGKVLRSHRMSHWHEYVDLLKSNPDKINEFINIMTTNKTHFFREKKHFMLLKEMLIEKKQKIINDNAPNFWVAACSFGQEAYSIAMLLADLGMHKTQPRSYRILATDIDTNALSIAKNGIYESEAVENFISPEQLKKFFFRGKNNHHGKYKFSDQYAENIKFRHHNLCDFNSSLPLEFDFIFLRNVLIYFDSDTQYRVITKMVNHLKVDGIMFLGHCESILTMKWDLEPVGPSAYRKQK